MAHYYIKATYVYEGKIEGKSEEDAYNNFLKDLNQFYSYTEEMDTEMVCDQCENTIESQDDLNEYGQCEVCVEAEEEELVDA